MDTYICRCPDNPSRRADLCPWCQADLSQWIGTQAELVYGGRDLDGVRIYEAVAS